MTYLFKWRKEACFFCGSFCDFLLCLQFQLCTTETEQKHSEEWKKEETKTGRQTRQDKTRQETHSERRNSIPNTNN
jgi:hypothetical protein